MAIVAASMMIIVLTAIGVLGAAFGMHLIARSPRSRARLRRWAMAAAASSYSVRRHVAYQARRAARFTRRRFRPLWIRTKRRLAPQVARGNELIQRAAPLADRARPVLARVKAGAEFVRPLAPAAEVRPSNSPDAELVPVTALLTETPAVPRETPQPIDMRAAR
jgi:hypothetical protein